MGGVLRETGFAETASLPGLIGPTGGEGQIGILARKAWQRSLLKALPGESVQPSCGEVMAYFRGRKGLGVRLAERLRAAGLRCRLARRGSQFGAEGEDGFTLRADAAEDWKQLMEVCSESEAPERVVYLWTLDEPRKPILC